MSAAAWPGASCSIADEDACGEHQVLQESSEFRVCVCDAKRGYVFDGASKACKRCGEDKVVRNGTCVAEQGEAPAPGVDDAGASDAGDSGSDAPGEPMPTGLGEACSTSADCASFDATFCDSFMTHSCLVEKCATGENACPASWACCDFSKLLTGLSICVREADLASGQCPMGGMRVTP